MNETVSTNYTQENKSIVTVSFNRAVAIIAGAVISGLVGGIFTGVSITRSTAFTVNSHTNAIEVLSSECARKDVVAEQYRLLDVTINDLKSMVRALDEKLERHATSR